jgi:hypothetical protein
MTKNKEFRLLVQSMVLAISMPLAASEGAAGVLSQSGGIFALVEFDKTTIMNGTSETSVSIAENGDSVVSAVEGGVGQFNGVVDQWYPFTEPRWDLMAILRHLAADAEHHAP